MRKMITITKVLEILNTTKKKTFIRQRRAKGLLEGMQVQIKLLLLINLEFTLVKKSL